jgi:hypothetical protein
MKIGLHDHESKKYPNLALMKLSAFHKSSGDLVEWYEPGGDYDKVYSSKVFTWGEIDPDLPNDVIMGGTGFDLNVTLESVVEAQCPDYELYGVRRSYGFLTRGCIRKCKDCFVPKKEGAIRRAADISEFLRHDSVALMDNNVLAHPHGISQIEKLAKLGVRVDFNQGLDARLIDNSVAKLLAKVRWHPELRLACDSVESMDAVTRAVSLLRWHNVSPKRLFCYVLSKDFESTYSRVKMLKGIYVDPFVQTLRNMDDSFVPTKEMMDLKRYVNNRRIFRSCSFEDYKRLSG